MNLNDPFGRLASKQEREYAHLVKSLQHANIHTREQVEQLLTNVKTRGWVMTLAILLTILLSTLFLDEVNTVVNAIALFAFFWMYTTSQKGIKYLRRYMEQDLPQAETDSPDAKANESNSKSDPNV